MASSPICGGRQCMPWIPRWRGPSWNRGWPICGGSSSFGVFASPSRPHLDRSLDRVCRWWNTSNRARPPRLTWRAWSAGAVEDEEATRALYQDLLDYLEGRRTRLGWSLDLRLASGDFQRRVLRVTSRLPYGAVTSYGHIAARSGRRAATRAVAGARRNPCQSSSRAIG
jgi:hypothetical protein